MDEEAEMIQEVIAIIDSVTSYQAAVDAICEKFQVTPEGAEEILSGEEWDSIQSIKFIATHRDRRYCLWHR